MTINRVLLGDHCPAVRQGLRHLLEVHRDRWQICAEVSQSEDLIEQAAHAQPAIVILDDQLPGASALENADQLRAVAPSSETILYIRTETPFLLARYNRSKVCGCFLKSEPIEDLLTALEVVSGHHRFRSRKITELCEAHESSGEVKAMLTPREFEVLQLITEDYPQKQIAGKMGLSIKTVDSHRANIFRKVGVHSAVGLVRYALRNGLIEL